MIQELKTCGVYKITCIPTGKCYVGSTRVNFNERFAAHRLELRKNSHANVKMQSAWNKYGANAFAFDIIESCDENIAYDREQFHIEQIKPVFNILKSAYPSAKRGTHGGMTQWVNYCINEIIAILIRCNCLKQFCEWKKTQREFFGFAPAPGVPESVRLKMSIAGKGCPRGGKGKPKTPDHRAAQSAARYRYVERMKSEGKWPLPFYAKMKTSGLFY